MKLPDTLTIAGEGVAQRSGVTPVEAGALEGRRLRYYDYCMVAFAVILICSNLVGAAKVSVVELPWIGPFVFGSAVLFFPLSYVLGDVLTEVYGYARARRVVWVGFAASIYAAGMTAVIVAIPPAPGWQGQEAIASVFGQTPRIFAASILAFWCGEFANAYVLAWMKVLTRGHLLWTRTIGSTVVGQAVDSLIFYPLAFLGTWETHLVISVMISNYLLKVGWEALLTPVTYKIVGFMKRREGVDVFDVGTDFTPFKVKV
ncbi:queuosine precursor transporter [Xanthobacter sp. KR7-65]|uniref:queuosine precursor transporter n=1 Tax=Xanthobacter sp. KR7-65 TaxID=3156612 RepID=UPI0032B368D4